ncbi:MAG: YhfC family intramembrane metalloprotease, partial [Chloroflexi bacterium]|nr:YhfC family intramembrane metalloprotease [Chloroflexota bacterium]
KLSWKLFLAGALTFIASQVLHIPFLQLLTAMFKNGTLPSPPEAWKTIFNAILLGLLAGIFEQTARYILFKFFLKKARAWKEGVLVGAGHGGVEAMILGALGVFTIINMVILRNADLSAMGIPAGQLELTKQQVTAFWASPAYTGLLGFVERVFAISLQISLSVMVLYSITNNKPLWFWIALFWHALVDGVTVFLAVQGMGALILEGIVGIFAIISLWIIFALQPKFHQHTIEPSEQGGVAT